MTPVATPPVESVGPTKAAEPQVDEPTGSTLVAVFTTLMIRNAGSEWELGVTPSIGASFDYQRREE
jgi:hypothetical protein